MLSIQNARSKIGKAIQLYKDNWPFFSVAFLTYSVGFVLVICTYYTSKSQNLPIDIYREVMVMLGPTTITYVFGCYANNSMVLFTQKINKGKDFVYNGTLIALTLVYTAFYVIYYIFAGSIFLTVVISLSTVILFAINYKGYFETKFTNERGHALNR